MKNQIENTATPNMSQKLLEIGVKKQAVQKRANEQAEIVQTKIYFERDIRKEYLEALKQEFMKHIGPSLIEGVEVNCDFHSFQIVDNENRELFTIHCKQGWKTITIPNDKKYRKLPEINYYTGGSTNSTPELKRLIMIGDVAKFILHYGKYLSEGLGNVDSEFAHFHQAEMNSYQAKQELNLLNTEINQLNREWAVEFAVCNGGIKVEESKKSIWASIPGNKRERLVSGVKVISQTEKRMTLTIGYMDTNYVEDKSMDRKAAEEIIYDIYKTHNVKEV